MTFHPDQFSLYNREARKILDRLGYGSKVSLEAYQELVRKLRNDLGSQDYLELDWFLYRVNRGAYSDFFNDLDEAVSNDSEPIELVEPYSQIFASFEEAEWAFDLLAETCARLGIEHAADERFAITLVERYGGLSLHFNFCDWLILGFRPPELAQKRVRLPLIVESAPFGKSFIEYEFEQGTDESPIAAYGLPIEKVRGWDTELQTLFAETLTAIAQRFSPTTYARDEAHHQPSLAATIFDKNARLSFLTDPGASPPQLPITNYQSPEPQSTISPSPHLPISNLQPPVSNPPYPLSQLAADTGLPEAELDRWRRAIERKKQIILYGPPGTGKTFVAEKLAQHLVAEGDGFVEFVQFHPAYAYEDFIQGLRPQARPDGGLDYPLVPGRFLEFCERAKTRQGICVLIIDEINRANLARVFGELMVLLEYRDKSLPLAGGGQLTVPDRVRLIGTMNTADRSIALVDHALRRRFAFIALHPNFDILRHFHTQAQTGFAVDKLIDVLTRLNRRIGDPHFEIGITYFLRQELAAEIKDIWQMEIEPYLEEYFFDQPDSVDAFRWEQIGREIVEMQDD
ncbi:MAG: AAA family ATPase [Anaerolineae bacterium]|nr:AAA family ATPase [Anaerolineae bacterium]